MPRFGEASVYPIGYTVQLPYLLYFMYTDLYEKVFDYAAASRR